MPALTRRRDPHRPDRWDIYFGDVAVGSIGRCAGVPVHVDQWEWGCGLSTVSRRDVSAGGTAASFDDAKAAFGAAWAKLEPLITPEDYDAYRRQRAWTAWKYDMQDARLPLSTQVTTGRSKCFCGVEIDIRGVAGHVAAAHLEMQ
jgi:hypothetical protein